MERGILAHSAGVPVPVVAHFGSSRGRLVYGEIATDEIVRPGQRIQLWMIVTNVGDATVRESMRLSLAPIVPGEGPLALERSLELTVPAGESRVASFDIAAADIAVSSRVGGPAIAASGEFDLTIAPMVDGDRRHARVRLAADWFGELTDSV